MPKHHLQLVEEAENKYIHALVGHREETIRRTLHEEIVSVSHMGHIYKGVAQNPFISSKDWKFEHIEVSMRYPTLFNSVAIVIAYEQRKGTYQGLSFDCEFCMTRTWKFEDNRWQIIASVAQQMDTTQVIDIPQARR